MGPVDPRPGIGRLEATAGTHRDFLQRPRVRWRCVWRVRTLPGRSRLRAPVHRARGTAHRGCGRHRGAATSGRGAVSDVDVTAAEFARISGENEREYPEIDEVDSRGGGRPAGGTLPPVVRGRGKF